MRGLLGTLSFGSLLIASTACSGSVGGSQGKNDGGVDTPGQGDDAPSVPLTFPDETTTGPAPGITVMTGNVTLGTAGAMFKDIDLDGCLTITAANVTVDNVRVRCSNATFAGIAINGSATGVVIEDVEVDGEGVTRYGLRVDRSATLRRVDVHGARTGIYISSTGVVVEDSYVHDLAPCPSTPACGTDKALELTLSAAAAGSVLLSHNSFGATINSGPAVGMESFDHPVTLEDSLLDGGSYCLQFYNTNYTINGNHFGSTLFATCGKYAPTKTNAEASASWTGNVWHESGAPVPAP